MKALIAALASVGCLSVASPGTNVGASTAPPPAACGADTSVANANKAALVKYLTLVDRTAFGFPFPPPNGSVVQVTAKNTCSAAITAYNNAFPPGHPSRLAAGIYLYKVGTTRYIVKNKNLMHFYNTSWNLLFAVSGD